jgi:hypothetical protein
VQAAVKAPWKSRRFLQRIGRFEIVGCRDSRALAKSNLALIMTGGMEELFVDLSAHRAR